MNVIILQLKNIESILFFFSLFVFDSASTDGEVCCKIEGKGRKKKKRKKKT